MTVAPPDPTAPGPFAFADPNRVRSILVDAGFGSVTINPFDACIGGGEVEQTLKLGLGVGPLSRALREHPELTDNVAVAVRNLLLKNWPCRNEGVPRKRGKPDPDRRCQPGSGFRAKAEGA